jgi:hypothetical protein
VAGRRFRPNADRDDVAGDAGIDCDLKGVPVGLDFLPSGEAVVTEMHDRALMRCVGGEATVYADLSRLAGTIDDLVIDGAGWA